MTSQHPNKKRRYPLNYQLKRKVTKIVILLALGLLAAGVNYFNSHKNNSQNPVVTDSSNNKQLSANKLQINLAENNQTIDKIRQAAGKPGSRFWLTIQGEVIKLLKDDLKGSQHQKFLIKVAPQITLLVAHNIDLAHRVPVKKGDIVSVRGRYEWNNRGGVIHWTHHDPKGKQAGGWVSLNGKEYR